MDPEYSPFIIMFHLLQLQPVPPTPSQLPPALLTGMTQSSSCWGYKRIKSLMKTSQESDFFSMTYNETHTRWSWCILSTNSPLTARWWDSVECLKNSFPLPSCRWRRRWVTRMDGFLRANLSDRRHTWNRISRPRGDDAPDRMENCCVMPRAKTTHLRRLLAQNVLSLL